MNTYQGYEEQAANFIQHRGQASNGVGSSSVRDWAKSLPKGSHVLDLGCGTGIPISKVLIEEGLSVYGIDASPSLVEAFQQNFPNTPVACESVEESSFFNRKFDGIIAWGLMFLLPEQSQHLLIEKAANALQTGGRFLFTSPYQIAEWNDILTGQLSISLGVEKYRELLSAAGFNQIKEFDDEGENHYYDAVKS